MSALTRDQAKSLIDRVLKLSKADAVQVNVSSGDERNVRFADNRITTAGATDDLSVRVFSAFGKRGAVSSGNDVSNEGLEQIVRQSETMAKLAPENPEMMPLLGPQSYKTVNGWFDSTARVTAEARARAAGTMIDAAKKGGDLKAAGILIAQSGSGAVGNNAGLFAFHPATSVDFTTTVRTTDGTGSGWAGANDPDWSKIDFTATSNRAVTKARLSRNPSPIEPGRYTVILEPAAAGDLAGLVANAFDARSAEEGRSAFSKAGGGTKVGEKIMDERVSFISDPADPAILSTPFDGDGQALGRQVWIENGVLRNLVYSRFWAQRKGVQSTGQPASLMVTGGTQSLDEMIASTERAVLVTRFWYIRPVNNRTLLYTGLTRDGTFLVENGKIVRSLRNMRFNESPLFMLDKLDAIGRPVRVGGDVLMPPIRVRDFHFTSLSDAV
jgi:predicted Zn-dependent protease